MTCTHSRRCCPPIPLARAQVRSMALAIACDIHPLNNLRVLNYLRKDLGQNDDGREDLVSALGRRGFPRHWSCKSRNIPARAAIASATACRWPTCAWCRRCITRAASTAISRRSRRWLPSARISNHCQPSIRHGRKPSPTPHKQIERANNEASGKFGVRRDRDDPRIAPDAAGARLHPERRRGVHRPVRRHHRNVDCPHEQRRAQPAVVVSRR